MLPTLSHLSVNHLPGDRLRHRYSSRYLQISPLHLEFYLPLSDSSLAVPSAVPQLSCRISRQAYKTAYMPFTPNNSEQRLSPTCYRGCWHVVSRDLFTGSCHRSGISSQPYSSPAKGFYNLSAFVIHAASLRQTFVHCGIFLAAASRRSFGPYLSPNVGVHPLRPPTDRRLGGPLPPQLANQAQAHLRSVQPDLSSYNHGHMSVFGITHYF